MKSKTAMLAGCALVLLVLAAPGRCESVLKVRYNGDQDQLTIEAREASLRRLLGLISLQTGIAVSMEPAAERHVNLSLKNQPMENALKRMARQLNLSQAMYYRRDPADEDKEPLLVGMKVVRTGKPDAIAAEVKPVVSIEQEAAYRSRMPDASTASTDTMRANDSTDFSDGRYSRLRWEERLSTLPEDKRQQVETLVRELREKRAERKLRIEEKREKSRAAREDRKAERQERKESRNPQR